MRSSTIPGLASQLSPFPPTMSNVGTGISIPTAQSARLFTDATISSLSNVETLEDIIASTNQSKNVLGSVIEAGEDLESIISKVLISKSASVYILLLIFIRYYLQSQLVINKCYALTLWIVEVRRRFLCPNGFLQCRRYFA